VATFLARIYVSLKPTVNDPQGLTIAEGLRSLGFSEIEAVRAGKYLAIRLTATSPDEARTRVDAMCEKLLANPIIESYRFDVESVDQARERLRSYVERAKVFTGWMPDVRTRPLGPRQPWDYMARARQLMASAASVLDMGTGGGERFGALLDVYMGRALATEEWSLNVPIAAAHLKPLGADTVHCRSTQLPVIGDSFDLVLNRHEDLWPVDVARVLKPGGSVLTQQAWMIWKELNRFIPRRIFLEDLFERYRDGFAAAASKSSTPAPPSGPRHTKASAISSTCSALRPGKSLSSTPWAATSKPCWRWSGSRQLRTVSC
jgi:phosphoribosylformylglycinamidine synthase subunit PurS